MISVDGEAILVDSEKFESVAEAARAKSWNAEDLEIALLMGRDGIRFLPHQDGRPVAGGGPDAEDRLNMGLDFPGFILYA